MNVVERVMLRTLVRNPVRTPDDRRRGAGRSHPSEFRMGKTVLPDLLVGRLQTLDQRLLGVIAAEVAIDGHQRFHRQSARFLPAFVAAHAVRYHGQPPLAEELPIVLGLPIAKRILVILAHAADVGLARYLNPGANLHPGTTSVTGMTSIGDDCLPRHRRTSDYIG